MNNLAACCLLTHNLNLCCSAKDNAVHLVKFSHRNAMKWFRMVSTMLHVHQTQSTWRCCGNHWGIWQIATAKQRKKKQINFFHRRIDCHTHTHSSCWHLTKPQPPSIYSIPNIIPHVCWSTLFCLPIACYLSLKFNYSFGITFFHWFNLNEKKPKQLFRRKTFLVALVKPFIAIAVDWSFHSLP